MLSTEQVFSTEYIPASFKYREKQLETLMERSTQTHGTYCEGEKSTGKTLTTLKYIESFQSQPDHMALYFKSERAVMMDFKKAVETRLNRKLKWGEYAPRVYFNQRARNLTIVWDDAQKIFSHRVFNDFSHTLYEYAGEHHKKLHFIVVGTATYPQFLQHVRDDVQSRYQFYPVIFPLYDAVEITNILRDRLNLAGITYEEGAIRFVAAKVRNLASDLRLALEVMKNALPHLNDGVTMETIEKAWNRTKTDYWKNQILEMDEHSEAILLSATQVAIKKPIIKTTGQPEIATTDITRAYWSLCMLTNRRPLYAQRVNYILSKLSKLGWLTQVGVESRGRHGRSTIYRYEMNPETIMKTFREIGKERGE